MRRFFLLALTLCFTGCPSCPGPNPTPPNPPIDFDMGFPSCSVPASVTMEDGCGNWFTSDGFNCVRCKNVSGCIDRTLMVYCVGSNGCAECNYAPRNDPASDAN